jgi:uroporphyrinogen-III synthase
MTDRIIINTRPQELQLESNQLLTLAGFDVIELPCIEISANNTLNSVQQLKSISANDIIIFTSQFAVSNAYKLKSSLKFSESNILICVGTKTSECLELKTTLPIWVPEKQNSEGVIELLKGLKSISRIVLITGAEGREEIQNYANQNGIGLQQINVYKRVVPVVTTKQVDRLKQDNKFQTLATSTTTLINLKQMLSEQVWQKFLINELICASSRIQQKAIEMGFKKTLNVETANIEKIIAALKKANI